MSRNNILTEHTTTEKLQKLNVHPTIKHIARGYFWRYNEQKFGKGDDFWLPRREVVATLEKDILATWNFARLTLFTLGFFDLIMPKGGRFGPSTHL